MLAIPLILPQESPALHQSFRPRAESPPPAQTGPTSQVTALLRQQQQRRDEERKAHNARSPLAQLTADEQAIAARKVAIGDYGSYWIRPPGIGKTLQAMREEEQERLEQEEFARQEMGWRDMQAVQEQEDARQRAATTDEQEAADEAEPERDLDDDIPEAEATTTDLSFNEDSVMEDSHVAAVRRLPGIREDADDGDDNDLNDDADSDERHDGEHDSSGDDEEILEAETMLEEAMLEEAELTGAARDEEALGLDESERNLDDSIPEAGSYEHTDTENEDSSELDSSLQASFVSRSPTRSARVLRSATDPQRRAQRESPLRLAGSPIPTLAHTTQRTPAAAAGAGGLQARMRALADIADPLPRSPGSFDLSSSIIESSFMESSPVLRRGNTARLRGRTAPVGRRRPGRRGDS